MLHYVVPDNTQLEIVPPSGQKSPVFATNTAAIALLRATRNVEMLL